MVSGRGMLDIFGDSDGWLEVSVTIAVGEAIGLSVIRLGK